MSDSATQDALHAAARAIENGSFALCASSGELPPHATHLVREDNACWTLRTYLAVARGLLVITPAWVFQSLEAGAWLPVEDFACAALGLSAQACTRMRLPGWAGALGGTSVCLFGETHLPRATVAALVRAAGGRVETSHRLASVLLSDLAPPQADGARRARELRPTKWLFDEIKRAATERPVGDQPSSGPPKEQQAEQRTPSHSPTSGGQAVEGPPLSSTPLTLEQTLPPMMGAQPERMTKQKAQSSPPIDHTPPPPSSTADSHSAANPRRKAAATGLCLARGRRDKRGSGQQPTPPSRSPLDRADGSPLTMQAPAGQNASPSLSLEPDSDAISDASVVY
jgi:hypothetical protein